ncbi:hypothetical protein [Halorubrum vacuolatum]|uniref:Uncharacterized protein n=1 Tax=Halorubrum vacuolatum TaxID=63740 RepID=A0A238UQ09_HALVU|nr:hypothetical protein [Halorubrum vacuolatum]SNR24021.1 hypothetical protein SAMN06264855_101210 [Halorubrum vacuolatum]
MAPTLVNAALGALLAAALLGAAFDRRSVAIVVGAAIAPDLDAVVSLAVPGATNALFHNVWIPLGFAALLYWDVTHRKRSWLRRRYGAYGVRVAWVALAAFAVAGIAPELFGLAGANLLYPVHDAYYLVQGRLLFSTQEGVVQTFLALDSEGPGILPLYSPGTTETYFVPTWVNPEPGPGTTPDAERELYFVRTGWQAVVVAAATCLLAVRFLEDALRGGRRRNADDHTAGGEP